MDLKQASNLIKETFNSSFDRIKFIKFIKELLNEIDESKAQSWNKQYVKHAFHDGVKKYERIGTYTAPEGEKIDILIVYLEKETTLERARTLQRNFAAYHLKKRAEKDAGLVAFVSPNNDDWRFSLVRMEYNLEKTDSGKVKIQEDLTPSKRFSFIVGKNENSHTAQKQLLPILKDDENPPTLKEIEKAFSIETVTKEFFNKYKNLFLNFKEELDKIIGKDSKVKSDFEAKGINTADFAKKLLGQVVFLYFLQRKGWLGVDKNQDWGQGPKNFLRALFDKKYCEYKNFFNEVLEPLFYEALATDRGEKAYYSRFDCRIPFLNGGLFEPLQNYDWENTDITIPNDLFSNDVPTKEGDKGSGILDFFDRYNFTIKEDEPLEKEVAIDPEMLGKVFENLLEIKDRKSKGAYYTPREIVHYMCQESLINYLATDFEGKVPREDIETFIHLGDFAVEHDMAKTQGIIKDDGKYKLPKSIHEYAELIDQKLADITVCDPAIGSGAFPVGMMNEIVRARGALNATKAFEKNKTKRTPYFFKRHTIQNSLYGVDIDPGAVEIAKLRLWLSLVVDEEEMADIKPLPNLDYKIMQGNSLLEEYEGIKLFDESLIMDTGKIKKERLEEIRKRKSEFQQEYFKLHSDGELSEVRKTEIEKEMKALVKEEAGLHKVEVGENRSLFGRESRAKKKAEELNRLHKEFFNVAQKSRKNEIKQKINNLEWELIEETLKEQGKEKELPKLEKMKVKNNKPFFLWKLHFAEVFQEKGGFDVVIANPPYVGHKGGQKDLFQELKKTEFGKRFNNERMDLFYYFFHLGLGIGRIKGEVVFITTNYYVTADSAIKLRTDFKNRASVRKLVNFNELKIFDSAKGQHNILTFLTKIKDETLCDIYSTNRTGEATPKILLDILSKSDNETTYYELKQDEIYVGNMNYIRLYYGDLNNKQIIDSILKKVITKGNPLIESFNISQGLVSGIDKISKKHIKKIPSLLNREGEGVYVIDNSKKNNLGKSPLLKPWFKNSDITKYKVNENNSLWVIQAHTELDMDNYPNIKDHLEENKQAIELRNYGSGELSKAKRLGKWWAMSSSRREFDFSKPKIVSPQRSYNNTFAYTEKEWTASADVYFITSKEESAVKLKYILALLNSKLYYLWLYHRGKRKGKMLELYLTPLSEIPIKNISLEAQSPFIDIVDKILAITSAEDYDPKNPPLEQKELEAEIDQMVYELYGLTEEEIQIIESNL